MKGLTSESSDLVKTLAAHLRSAGALAVLPTDTTYGLIARAGDAAAIRRIYQLKGRSAVKPLPCLFGAANWVERYCDRTQLSEHWKPLTKKFWRGPLNFVLPAGEALPKHPLGGGQTVACRVPDNDLLIELLRELDEPLVAPSANPAAEPTGVDPQRIAHWLEAEEGLLLDVGVISNPTTSTIIDLSGEKSRLLREGRIAVEEIEAVIGRLER
ncbi:threonylcarbamoyl-AMP synthase [bacterium]|nr:threonylcarbamoyl-AMP synthase [bacterium]